MMVRILLLLTLLAAAPAGPVTYDRLLHADREPHNWLSYSGNYAGHRYSPLSQIDRTNVKYLQLKWSYHPLYAKNGNAQNKMENTPLVADGIMYTGTALEAVALDAVTGRQFWKLPRPLDPKAYYNAYEVNKGMALAGETLFWATVDCHLLAIDAKTGRVIWDKVASRLQEGLPIQHCPAHRPKHGDPRAGHQRSRRELLGGGLRHRDREGALAIRHGADISGRASGEDLGG